MSAPASAANRLVLEHLDWARRVAASKARRIFRVPSEDVVATGLVGLVQAARSWRPETGVPFQGYARYRIEGAIADMLRIEDVVGRDTRGKINAGAENWTDKRGLPRHARDYDDVARRKGTKARQEDSAELGMLIRRIRRLPARLAYVAGHYYLAGEPMREIGKQLDVSEARVCQLLRDVRMLLELPP